MKTLGQLPRWCISAKAMCCFDKCVLEKSGRIRCNLRRSFYHRRVFKASLEIHKIQYHVKRIAISSLSPFYILSTELWLFFFIENRFLSQHHTSWPRFPLPPLLPDPQIQHFSISSSEKSRPQRHGSPTG